ncbi:hypothetical protein [Streptococcus himalayensis]|uniref:Bacteriocin n=1 Tax=Streptococcus himalayensis TaxID=1888195 RepID=A0A917A3W1_9STRE|nr:hypothetical protein [Streptococcus himalayensis]GGE24585.1 hypothetical protein GCM10011510_02100 [Streptococcus himalayensis]
MLNLKNAAVMELTAEELMEVEGGYQPIPNPYGGGGLGSIGVYPGWAGSNLSPNRSPWSWAVDLGGALFGKKRP